MRWVLLALFGLTYVGISARRLRIVPVGRPAMALIGAVALVVAGTFAGPFGLTADEALAAVEPHTIALLFGMMVVAAGLGESGFFAWSTRWLARRVRSHTLLLYVVTIGSGLLSAVLVNDAVCLLVTPLVVQAARRLSAAERPILLGIAMGSNAGSALTLSGNPQNMLVARLSGLTYGGYLSDALLPTLAALGLTAVMVHLFFRRELVQAPPHEDEPEVKLDRPLLVATLASLVGVIVANLFGASLAGSAMAGAAVVLLAARLRADSLLHQVDWSVLVFFAALFVVVAALQKTSFPADWLAAIGPSRSIWVLFVVLLVGSQIVSNVPLILLLAPWIRSFPDPTMAWTVTALTTTLAGNFTLLGSVANIIVMERSGVRFGFFEHAKIGAPITLVSTAAAVAIYLFV
jgi:Na+/H+ antiporter NhaD/arsenite permease-like protein